MTSKNSFFNMMKENIKQRLWTVALITLIFFFTFPVQTALKISSILDRERISDGWKDQAYGLLMAKQQLQQWFLEQVSIENGMLIFLIGLFAVVCGISGFSYLHSRKKTDFYHSVPVRREKLFAVVYLEGVLYTAVPYLINLLIAAVMVQIKTGAGLSWGKVLLGYGIHMAFFLLIYATVVTAVVMTGHLIVSLLGTIVFFVWGPGVLALYLGYCSYYYITFYESSKLFDKLVQCSSPAAWYMSAIVEAEKAGGRALWALASAAVITALAVFLYKKRPSEAAGRAMAFKKSQPVIKFLLVVPLALLGSLLFQSMMGTDGWSLFGLICGLLITYCIVEIIYNFDFRRLFAHKKQLAVCAVCSAAVLAFFRFDLSGYDSYIPSEAKLESAGVYCRSIEPSAIDVFTPEPELEKSSTGDRMYVSWDYMTGRDIVQTMNLSDTQSVLEVARRGVEDISASKKVRGRFRNRNSYVNEDSRDKYGSVLIGFHLKNGKTVLRNYYVNLTSVKVALDRIHDETEYKTAIYPVLRYKADELAGINYQEYQEFKNVNLKNDESKGELLSIYQKELGALTAETRRKESPIAAIQFKTEKMQEMIDMLRKNKGDYTVFNEYLYYPIYPSFTGTIELLKQNGIEVGTILTSDKVEKIVMRYAASIPADEEDEITQEDYIQTESVKHDDSWTVSITDKKEIQELLDSSSTGDLNCSNYMNKEYTGVRITAYVPLASNTQMENTNNSEFSREAERDYSGDYKMYNLKLDYDKVPEFVKETFDLDDEKMQYDMNWAY